MPLGSLCKSKSALLAFASPRACRFKPRKLSWCTFLEYAPRVSPAVVYVQLCLDPDLQRDTPHGDRYTSAWVDTETAVQLLCTYTARCGVVVFLSGLNEGLLFHLFLVECDRQTQRCLHFSLKIKSVAVNYGGEGSEGEGGSDCFSYGAMSLPLDLHSSEGGSSALGKKKQLAYNTEKRQRDKKESNYCAYYRACPREDDRDTSPRLRSLLLSTYSEEPYFLCVCLSRRLCFFFFVHCRSLYLSRIWLGFFQWGVRTLENALERAVSGCWA